VTLRYGPHRPEDNRADLPAGLRRQREQINDLATQRQLREQLREEAARAEASRRDPDQGTGPDLADVSG
jgi:hypothetical protein